jgi:hypothetical protein
MRVMKLLGLITLLLGVLIVPAAAQVEPYPPAPGGCDLEDNPDVLAPGESHTVSTHHCDEAYAPGAAVSHVFTSTPVNVGTSTANANGTHSHTYAIPADATAGEHTISATGLARDGSTLTLTETVTVTGQAGAARAVPAGRIPFTGSSGSTPAIWVALAALVAGAAMVIGARRRATVRNRQSFSN